MNKYKLIIFDLDGTLTDSGDGIINSVQYALKKIGIIENDRLKLRAFVGPPLIDSFMELYGLGSKEAWQAVQYYREYFVEQGMFENRVYTGIPALLAGLCDSQLGHRNQPRRLCGKQKHPRGQWPSKLLDRRL